MFKMTEPDAERWERTREKGKWLYIARKVGIYVILEVFAYAIVNILFNDPVILIPRFLIIFPPLAVFGAVMEWTFTEAKYKTFILDKKIAKGLRVSPQLNK